MFPFTLSSAAITVTPVFLPMRTPGGRVGGSANRPCETDNLPDELVDDAEKLSKAINGLREDMLNDALEAAQE